MKTRRQQVVLKLTYPIGKGEVKKIIFILAEKVKDDLFYWAIVVLSKLEFMCSRDISDFLISKGYSCGKITVNDTKK